MDDPGGAKKRCPSCAEEIQQAAIKCRFCGTDLANAANNAAGKQCPPEEQDRIRRHLRKLNALSFAFGIPGLALQFGAGAFAPVGGRMSEVDTSQAAVVILMRLVGVALLIVGLVFNARWKGRHGAWGLLGLLSCLGLLVLYFISKSCHHCNTHSSYRVNKCPDCDAPM
jgi:hypothetical protein